MSGVMLAAYRHDAHKFFGESHADARETLAGIPVNQPVPHGADSDAAALSRPQQSHERTVPTHGTPYRLSLFTGEAVDKPSEISHGTLEQTGAELLGVEDAETAHKRWLASDVAAAFNESVYHPYTSLKYHTLLVASLLDAYRDDHDFADLRLIVDPPETTVPFRTVFQSDRFALRLATGSGHRPTARLGSQPYRSWAAVWNRLTAHPLDTDHDRYDMVLDANLRRLQSWSTTLQYTEEFETWRPDR